MSVRIYNPSVRVGNWNEDIQLEEDTLKNFLEKREKGELMIQKNFNLHSIMGKAIALSISQDWSIHFGDNLMIKCPAAADQTTYFRDYGALQACVVAVNVVDPMALLKSTLSGPVVATGCMNCLPNQRTVFCIESVDFGRKGAKLKYGEPFYLSTVGENTGKLYLRSDAVSLHRCAKKSRHQEVSLDPEPTYLSQWMAQHKNPLLRLEYEHEPVEANRELVIVHCKTNQCLAVEEKHSMRTPFGREYELSAHTFLDSHKAEMENNRWMMIVGVPGCSEFPVPEQGPAPASVQQQCC